MQKRTLVSLLICAVVLTASGIALAAAVKVTLDPFGGLEPDASGHAVLNYAKGKDKTNVQVNCWGLTPENEYTVYLNDGSYYPIGTFWTDEDGEGHLHVSLSGDASGDTPVAVNDSDLNLTVLLGG